MVCLAWLNGKKKVYIWRGFPSFAVHQPLAAYSDMKITIEQTMMVSYYSLRDYFISLFFFLLLVFLLLEILSFHLRKRASRRHSSLSAFFFFLSSSIRRGLCKSSGEEVTTVERNQEEGERKNHLFTWPILSRLSRCFTLGIQMFLPAGRKVEFFFFFFLQDLMD